MSKNYSNNPERGFFRYLIDEHPLLSAGIFFAGAILAKEVVVDAVVDNFNGIECPEFSHPYTVQSGDSLWTIARDQVDPNGELERTILVDTITEGNPSLQSETSLQPGTEIVLPPTGSCTT